jgi:hypothetical protein
MTARTVSDAISPSLVKLLMVDSTDAHDAVLRISRRGDLLEEAKAANAVVQRICQPVGLNGALIGMGPLLLMFDPPSFGKNEEGVKLADAWQMTYARALSDIPREALEEAVNAYIKIGKWFPKASEIRELAGPKMAELRKIAWRLKKVVEEARPPKPVLSEAEREANKRAVAELVAELRSRPAFGRRAPGESPQQMAARIRGESILQTA